MIKKISILALIIIVLSTFGYYAFQKVYSIEIPLYRNVFVDEGHDLVTDQYVILPYEILLNGFIADTIIDKKTTCYSKIVFRDKRTNTFEEHELLPYVDIEYKNNTIKLKQYSYSSVTDNMYFIILMEQRRYQYWLSTKH